MKKSILTTLIFAGFVSMQVEAQQHPRYLTDSLYMADPSAHVYNGRIYIYPSHDISTAVQDAQNGDHYNMKDYHVLSMDKIDGNVTDYGTVLDIKDIPWAGRQLWAPDCAYKDGKYYLYFPMKDKNDIFRIAVAIGNKPEGPFKAEKSPMAGSYSIDPAVFADPNGEYYMFFGGIQGGQLQRYRHNKTIECGTEPQKEANALCPKVAKLRGDMLEFAEEPKDVVIMDNDKNPLKCGDTQRRFFEGAWLHKYNGKYYLSYSTGTTHLLCYAISDNIYGPFIYQGVILTPVVGWTTHHSIVEFNQKWYLFYHDSKRSGGVNYLRSLKVMELKYNTDGTIQEMNGQE